jgi:hypothetical protein
MSYEEEEARIHASSLQQSDNTLSPATLCAHMRAFLFWTSWTPMRRRKLDMYDI